MQSLVSRRLLAACARKIVKAAPHRPPCVYIVPPAVFFGRPKHRSDTATPQRHARPVYTPDLPKSRKRSGIRVFCAGLLSALPVAVKSVAVAAAHVKTSGLTFSGVSSLAVSGLAVGVANKGIRRWHAGRRSAKRGLVTAKMGPATEVSVVTFNIRGIMDRWQERAPLLQRVLKQADADVYCFQEVLTGEFGQDLLLLGSDYQVHECRAALDHLSASGWFGAGYAATVRTLLKLSWIRSLLVSLPPTVESWREANHLRASWSRLIRDFAIAPFYGNSIASRLPAVAADALDVSTPETSRKQAAGASSSSTSWGLSWWSFSSSSNNSSSNNSSSNNSSSNRSSSNPGDLLVLGDFRAAQRVCLQLRLSPNSSNSSSGNDNLPGTYAPAAAATDDAGDVVYVWLVNTHLDHAAPTIRARQMQAICGWMESLKQGCAGIILTGDLNAPPEEQVHATLAEHGFMSTHKLAHGTNPTRTWPSGIQAPLMDHGSPKCIDYIYAWQAPGYQLQVTTAQLCGDGPDDGDKTLYPSDHIGIKVRLRVNCSSGSADKNQ